MTIKIGYVNKLLIDSALVRDFYVKHWKREIALSEKFFYDWQFLQIPNNDFKDHCVVAFDDQKKEILGVMGLSKRQFFLNGKSQNGAELTTWVVSEDAIGAGLGARILAFIQEEFEVLIGMGISNLALPIYMRSGFRYVKNIPRFVKVINFEPLRRYSTYDNLAVKLIKKWHVDWGEGFHASNVSRDDYEKLFRCVKKKMNLFSRDEEHRLWRYCNHPYFKYQQYLVQKSKENSTEKVYIAFREDLSLPDFKIIHVLDLFGDDSCLQSAICFIERYARDNGFDVIDFYCTASSINRFMISGGWFSINDDICYRFPHLFHPIEMRDPPTTSLIFWSKNNFSDMADFSKLYISKQDADLDRPTLHTINSFMAGHLCNQSLL